jgi:glycosyltransferase involved in cell wall biosynthesis
MTVPASDLVSIALCTFNGERHLRAQLDSLLAQDWPRLEIVAIDDASTDGTPRILEDYACRHPGVVRYTRNATNQGYRKNFEQAMGRCTGRWIAPCDQDDIWLPNKVSRLAEVLQDGASPLAFCDSELMHDDGRPMGRKLSDCLHLFSTDDPVTLLMANMASGHAMLFSRRLLEAALPFPAAVFHDWWLAYLAVSKGPLRYVDECLVRYRQHERSVTDVSGRKRKETDRPRGFRALDLAATRARLEAFAEVPNRGQPLARELLTLWREHESSFCSWRLVAFLWRHVARLEAIPLGSSAKKRRRALKYFWGVRTKRLLLPQRYDPGPALP